MFVSIGAMADPPGRAAVLKGVVTDSVEGVPIYNAYVLVHKSFGSIGDLRIPVTRDGHFSADLTAGFYDVFVTAIGFSPRCSKLKLEASKVTVYNPQLEMSKIESAETAEHGRFSQRGKR
jgi:hypothetical protein